MYFTKNESGTFDLYNLSQDQLEWLESAVDESLRNLSETCRFIPTPLFTLYQDLRLSRTEHDSDEEITTEDIDGWTQINS